MYFISLAVIVYLVYRELHYPYCLDINTVYALVILIRLSFTYHYNDRDNLLTREMETWGKKDLVNGSMAK